VTLLPHERWPIALIVAYSVILGVSAGMALVAIALSVLALDRYDPSILDRVTGRG
jgi:hypothetical protein